MADKKIATGLIGNALRSSAADHTTTFTDEVFDTERQKHQSEVNTDIEGKIETEQERAEAAEQAIIYDVSSHNNGTAFESLSSLLSDSDLSTLIPTSVRHGGMTIRFIQGSEQGSDNKYVQYRLMSKNWSTTLSNWQGVTTKLAFNSKDIPTSDTVEKGFWVGESDTVIDLSDYDEIVYYISDQDKWFSTQDYKCKLVPVTGGQRYLIKNNDSKSIRYALLTTDAHTANTNASYATGCGRATLIAGDECNILTPSDAKYLFISTFITPDVLSPTVSKYNKHDIRVLDSVPVCGSKNPIESGGAKLIDDKIEGTRNYIEGYKLDINGNLVADSSAILSEKIPVNYQDVVSFSGVTGYICAYNKYDVKIDHWTARVSVSLTDEIDADVSYVRAGFGTSGTRYIKKGTSTLWQPTKTNGIRDRVGKFEDVVTDINAQLILDENKIIENQKDIADINLQIEGDEQNFIPGYKMQPDGVPAVEPNCFITKPISVSQNDVIRWHNGNAFLCVFDSNNNMLDYWSNTNYLDTDISLSDYKYQNASYLIASFPVANKATGTVKVNSITVFKARGEVRGIKQQIAILNKQLSSNFKIYNYYDNSLETETADALSSVRIPIPSEANYFLQTCSPYNIYGGLGFNFYDADSTLIETVRYSTGGIDRYLYNSANRCGLGFTIPQNSAYVRLVSNRSDALFSNMTAMFYASQSDIVVSTDLLFHEYFIAHLKELDDYIPTLKEQVEQVDKLKIATDTNTEIIDGNLVKQNYYNFAEETTASSTPDGVSSVKISIPSWVNYVLAGYTTKYAYVRVLFYDQSNNLIIEKNYNSEDALRFEYWQVDIGNYYYLGFTIPLGTEYIKIGHISHDEFMFETACVKFYKSIDDVPRGGTSNPYKSYQERNIPQLKEYAKINNWYYGEQLPNYYFPYLSNKAAEIESYLKTCASNCDVFFFITDNHFDFSRTSAMQLNAGWSFAMISYLRKYLRIDTILHGGDLMNLPLCGNFMEDYKQVIGTNQVYLALGNHEFISLADQNAINYYTRMLSNGMIYGDENKMWGYVDNPTRKSRYIVLSPFGPSPDGASSYIMDKLNDDNQYNWFVNTALNIPAGYTAIIVSHLLYTLSGQAGSPLILPTPSERYVNAIDNYSGVGKIACVLMGHTHSDRIHIGQTGIPYIISQTDRFYNRGGEYDDIGVTRTRGTITEQHFEVVVINKVAHEIKLFAIGSNSLDGMDDNLGVEVSARTLSNLTNI